MHKLTFFSLLILAAGLIHAGNVSIATQVPLTLRIGDIASINITVTNGLDRPLDGSLRVIVGNDIISPPPIYPGNNPSITAARLPYIQWPVHLNTGDSQTFNYQIQPKMVGEYDYDPPEVVANDGTIYTSTSFDRTFIDCNQNGICESKFGETYAYCPQDCSPWASDDRCNSAKDGHCDPDCLQGADPDCEAKPAAFDSLGLFGGICIGTFVLIAIIAIGAFLVSRRPKIGSYETLTENLRQKAEADAIAQEKPAKKTTGKKQA